MTLKEKIRISIEKGIYVNKDGDCIGVSKKNYWLYILDWV